MTIFQGTKVPSHSYLEYTNIDLYEIHIASNILGFKKKIFKHNCISHTTVFHTTLYFIHNCILYKTLFHTRKLQCLIGYENVNIKLVGKVITVIYDYKNSLMNLHQKAK